MKIVITTPEHSIRIGLPSGLIFSKGSALLAQRMAKKYAPEVNLPDGALPALCEQLRRIRKTHGAWTLVEVEASSGGYVQISL